MPRLTGGAPRGRLIGGAPRGRLILVRHGETTSNVMKRLDTRVPGAGLTDFGVRQAVRFGLERPDAAPRALITSVARRAQQTAELIGSVWGMAPEVLDGLHEVQVGELEDQSSRESHDTFGAVIKQWQAGELDAKIPGGESMSEVHARYLPAIEDVAARYLAGPDAGDVYLVSHGAAMRIAAAELTGLSMHFGDRERLPNTGTIELEYRPGSSRLGAADERGSWTCLKWGNLDLPFDQPEFDQVESPVDPMG